MRPIMLTISQTTKKQPSNYSTNIQYTLTFHLTIQFFRNYSGLGYSKLGWSQKVNYWELFRQLLLWLLSAEMLSSNQVAINNSNTTGISHNHQAITRLGSGDVQCWTVNWAIASHTVCEHHHDVLCVRKQVCENGKVFIGVKHTLFYRAVVSSFPVTNLHMYSSNSGKVSWLHKN